MPNHVLLTITRSICFEIGSPWWWVGTQFTIILVTIQIILLISRQITSLIAILHTKYRTTCYTTTYYCTIYCTRNYTVNPPLVTIVQWLCFARASFTKNGLTLQCCGCMIVGAVQISTTAVAAHDK